MPWNHESGVWNRIAPRNCILEGVIDGLVGMRVRIPELVRSARKVRRIDHRKNDIDLIDEHLPPLTDAHVRRVGRGQSKDIGSDAHSEWLESAANEPKLVTNHLRTGAAVG